MLAIDDVVCYVALGPNKKTTNDKNIQTRLFR